MARSMMFKEMSILAKSLPPETVGAGYRKAIIDDNILGKPTYSSREKSFRHLAELYSLDPQLALFRLLRKLAGEDPASLPLIALTCVFCRDAQLRRSFGLIDRLKPGELLKRESMEAHLESGFPGRFNPTMKKSLAQNVNTTWTAAGHLSGRARKIRALPTARLASSVYAITAGYLLGLRGDILLQSVFSRLVSPQSSILVTHLGQASARGWLRFRHGGGVTEIDCAPLLTPQEKELIHGAN